MQEPPSYGAQFRWCTGVQLDSPFPWGQFSYPILTDLIRFKKDSGLFKKFENLERPVQARMGCKLKRLERF